MRTLKVLLALLLVLATLHGALADPAEDLARGSFRTTYNYATGKIDFYRMYNGSDFCLLDGTNCALGGGANSSISGSGSANQLAFWNGPASLTSNANFTLSGTTLRILTTVNASRLLVNNVDVCLSNGTNCPASSGDNSSWNQSGATLLFYPRDSNPQGFYNVTNLPAYPIADNTSWNQSGYWINASESFYPLKTNPAGFYNVTTLPTYPVGDNSSWNESGAIIIFYPRNTNPQGFYNVTTLPAYPTADNASWNETRADAKYALIGGGGNSSWNQTLATTLYYPRDTNPASFYNVTTLPAYPTADNTSWNETGATVLYYPRDTNTLGFYNSSTIPSYVLVSSLSGAVGQNLTYALINTNMGNWSADKISYTLLSTLPGAVGQNLTYALVVANIGNWSADKTSYALNTHVANVNTTANIQILGFNTTTQLNVVYVRNTSIPTCGGTDKLTSAGNGIFTCATDQTGGGSSAGSGWLNTTNQVYLSNNATNVTVGKNTDSLPNLFVDNTNNFVGINTINPTTSFEVNGSTLIKGVLTAYSGQADAVAVAVGGPLTTYAAMQFIAEQNKTRDFIFSSYNGTQTNRMAFRVSGNEAGSNSGGDLSILRFDDSGTFIDTIMKFDRSDGYVGIGDSTPDAKLDVVGDVIIDGNLTLDGSAVKKSWTNYTSNGKQNVFGTTLANITGLEWNAAANTNYMFDCSLLYQSNLTTNGISFAMEDWGGTVTWFEVATEIHTVAAATVNSATANTTGTKMTSTAVTAANTKYRASLDGIIVNGASAVTITPQFSAEIAGSNSSIMRGSHCDVKVI